jgi:aspartyl-tRNA(Asn)/glutamyl-tRNA(Gln) amidotransferase subunit A
MTRICALNLSRAFGAMRRTASGFRSQDSGWRAAGHPQADVIASPTLCLTPPLMSDIADADNHLRVNRRIVRNTLAVNYLGLCAITMPVGRDRAGMPVGLQLTAPARAEEPLLAIALAAERVLGTAADRLGTPPLLAA